MRDATCEERIGENLDARLDYIGALIAVSQEGNHDRAADLHEAGEIDSPLTTTAEEQQGAAQERLWELPLGVSETRVFTILLSTGGPHDELRVEVDADNEIQRIEYRFLDWFDGATRVLDGDEYATAAEFAQAVVPALLVE